MSHSEATPVETTTPVEAGPVEGIEPVEFVEGTDESGLLFLCDHASNRLPAAYGTLGLPPRELDRHIAFDIGAAALTRRLASRFAAPALLTTFSRLLIDPNRGADDPTLVMRISDGAIVPGNAHIDQAEIDMRLRLFWQPYRDAIRAAIDRLSADGRTPVVLSIHTFTDRWRGIARPWEIGVLWDTDPRLAVPLLAGLRSAGFVVGDNEPYDGALQGDTLDEEVTRRGIAGLLIEVRQDLVADEPKAITIADRLAAVLDLIVRDPALRKPAFIASRTGRHAASGAGDIKSAC
jgi:predicted N-formylglutamate amidohydrolase